MQTEKKFEWVISACLLGLPCRFNAKGKVSKKALNLFLKGKAIAVCPEIFAGMKTPRIACEILNGEGKDVLSGLTKVVDKNGNDYSEDFIRGAKFTFKEIVKKHGIRKAILKSGSPSCGAGLIYDGKFSGKKIKGDGVFTALLRENNIEIYQESGGE
jgi:uncharacterized protein YbbK (DUF523 family)